MTNVRRTFETRLDVGEGLEESGEVGGRVERRECTGQIRQRGRERCVEWVRSLMGVVDIAHGLIVCHR